MSQSLVVEAAKENHTHSPGKKAPSHEQLDLFLRAQLENPTYPTRCLNFLKTVKKETHLNGSAQVPNPAAFTQKIVIVGAGLGGLSTAIALARRGHKVQVLEQARQLGEVGAGIQIPSNSSRILLEWGLGPYFEGKVVEPDGITFRRWQNGNAIGFTKLIPDFRAKYQAPYYVIHRAHFHDALHRRALDLGVEVKTAHRVVAFGDEEAYVMCEDGTKISGDLIVAADGIKSKARACIPGEAASKPVHTGFAAYRATVEVAELSSDPDTAWLLEKPALNVWIGENRHIMTYTISSGKSFNMVLSHVDPSDPASWRAETALDDMKAYFEGWDPMITKVLAKVKTTVKWPLMSSSPLEQWVSTSKKLIILGDAAHAMVPYMSQGAAMAVEDGAALAEALNYARDASDMPRVLSTFEAIRRQRSGAMQQASFINGTIWHFPDGPEQRARDLAMRSEVLGEPFEESPNQWSDPDTQKWAYGYDATEAISAELR